MPSLLWDASALAKRYCPEVGSDTVDALFNVRPAPLMVITFPGYAETYSVLVRKHNRGEISSATFSAAKSLLRLEVIDSSSFNLMAVAPAAILDGIDLIERYNLNASDAAILATYLSQYRAPVAPGVAAALIASDRHLLTAARAEGLTVLNPETYPAADVASFLASL
jgi:predicted nucleic acid-binding protein